LAIQGTAPSQNPRPGDEEFRRADLALADECRLNALWLHGSARGESALEIEVPSLPLSAALSALYRRVERLPFSTLSVPDDRCRIPFQGAEFDLVTLYGTCPTSSALREIRRVIADGGTALFSAENRWWGGRLRRAARPRAGAAGDLGLRRAVLDAGFETACAYWVEPSLAIPRNLIPAIRGRVRSFEAIRAREWGGDVLRSSVATLGLHGVLYPGLLVVAKA